MTDFTVTKAYLIEELVCVTDVPRKEAEAVVETIFGSIIGALQGGDRIEIRGFGSFCTHQRRGRNGRNPKTGAKVEVPPKRVPFFRPSKELKDHVNRQQRRARHALKGNGLYLYRFCSGNKMYSTAESSSYPANRPRESLQHFSLQNMSSGDG